MLAAVLLACDALRLLGCILSVAEPRFRSVGEATRPLFGAPQEVATSDDYYTPAWVFEDMGIRFDLDVAAPPGGVPWIPADRFLTKADDGLALPWEGRVWMNPPFSVATAWVTKFLSWNDGIALISTAVNAKWSTQLWEQADGIALLPQDMQFSRPGKDDSRPMYRSSLFAMGAECVEAIGRVGYVR